MRVEVKDNFLVGARNNANMSTPSDGLRPRMQLYTFFGPQAATLTLTPGGSVPVGTAAFGALNFTINALVSLAISTVVNPGYGGTLFVGSDNPLGGRPAFVGRSSGFPARQRLTLDLGTAFAGQTVRIRFRIATDAGVGDVGWELDNLEFLGITNLPFSTFVPDLSKCRGVPKK